jgi:hypothetical protein
MVSVHILDVLNPVADDLRKEIDVRLGREPTQLTGKPGFWAFLFPWIILPWFMAASWIARLVYTLAFLA